MQFLRTFFQRLLATARKSRLDSDLRQELQSHLDALTEEHLRRGLSLAEARAAARREFGGVEQTRQLYRDQRSLPIFDHLAQDIRYALRMLRKAPGISFVAVLTLAVGIGANTTVFSVLNSMFFRPLPFHSKGRLVLLVERNTRTPNWMRNPAMAAIFQWQQHAQSFSQIELAVPNRETVNVTLGNEAERLQVQFVTPGLTAMLGIQPIVGHDFDASQPTLGGAAGGTYSDIIISYAMWQRRWGGDPAVLGKSLTLFDNSMTIIGVMPPNAWAYPWARNIDLWVAVNPARDPKEFLPELRWLGVLAVLKPGIAVERARAEIDGLERHSVEVHSGTDGDWSADALLPQQAWFGDERKSFYLLLGAVAFILLIACANVANLLLARSGVRAREMAIRASIGGTRMRLLRQLLTESVLLAVIGGALALLLSLWGVKVFVALLPELGTLVDKIVIDVRVLLFTLGLATFTGILFGLAPAIHISSFDLTRSLKEGGERSSGRASLGGSLLVVGEIALTLVLLTGAGLMINSFIRLQRVDPGFNPAHMLIAGVELDGPKYKQFLENDFQRALPTVDDFFREAVTRLQGIPGAVSATLEGPRGQCLFRIAGQLETLERSPVSFSEVDQNYLRTMQIPLLGGRDLTPEDDELSPWVALVNTTLARRYFPHESPVGKQVYLTLTEEDGRKLPEPKIRIIVGIIADTRPFGQAEQPVPTLFVPYRQHVRDYLGGNAYTHLAKSLFIRTTGNPLTITRAARSIIADIDRTQPLVDIRTMEQSMAENLSPWRFLMQILGIFAGLAIALAAIGLYGVMSYTVSRRTRDIGVRVALGAGSRNILAMIMKYGLKLTFSGIGAGLVGSVVLTRLIGKMLYGISATDPLTFFIVSFTLAVFALAACFFPARRAMRLDPLVALRHE